MDERVYPSIYGAPGSPVHRRNVSDQPGTPLRFKQNQQQEPLQQQAPSRDQSQLLGQQPRRQIVSYGNRQPLKRERSMIAILLVLGYLAALGYYLYVRIMFTLDFSRQGWYSIMILTVEVLGITAVLPYALLQVESTRPSGSQGLPPDDGISTGEKVFNINVLVPCYKESMQVITDTVTAAISAPIPPGCTKKVWLCDDGGDNEKKQFMAKFGAQGGYVTGRSRKKGEMNGKSANVNNVLKNYIFSRYLGHEEDIPVNEVVVVFDADMCAKPNFFLKILEVLLDDSIALCLTPQAFSNINAQSDIFNNINQQFWEYVLPGCDAWGYIACTGTNFCIRAKALAACGWFPEYTITEDYALSMELKKRGFKGSYLCEYLAVGEAPEEARNVFRQRSRWTKGHMQIFFSSRCPLLACNGLNLAMKWLYTNGTWAYFCNIATTPTFMFVPFVSLMFGVHPVVFSKTFAQAATAYLGANFLVMNYFRQPDHLTGLWLANLSNQILCFTYFKAIANTLLSKVHLKPKQGFKVTEKAGGNVAPQAGTGIMGNVAALGRMVSTKLRSVSGKGRAIGDAASAAVDAAERGPVIIHAPKQQTEAEKEQKRWEEEVVTDKMVLMFAFQICFATIMLGIHEMYVAGGVKAHLVLPMLWAAYNATPAVIFFIYLFASSATLEIVCFWAHYLSSGCALGAMICLWFADTTQRS